MRALTVQARRAAYAVIVIGVILGIASYVRVASLFIAAATAVIALDNRSSRKIEMYLPLAIAVALFALAIALPRGL